MQFISLRIHPVHDRVVAIGNGLAGGNIIAKGKECIEWRNGQPANTPRVFLVRFFKYSGADQVPIWPFPDDAVDSNQQCLDAENVRWLRVANDKPAPPLRDDLGFEIVKYEAHVEASGAIRCIRDATIEELDPMIIIRPGLRSIIAAGVPWAIAGAAVGALVTAAILME